jgi:hypothetical protein
MVERITAFMLAVCQKLLLHSHDFWRVMSHIVLALSHAACATKVTLILN